MGYYRALNEPFLYKLLIFMYFLQNLRFYSTVLRGKIGGRMRGFRLEYEVFRLTQRFVGELEPKIL